LWECSGINNPVFFLQAKKEIIAGWIGKTQVLKSVFINFETELSRGASEGAAEEQ
jgi:hypothetical protein